MITRPTYLIFGAAGGIGSALCRQVAREGANIVLAGRTESKLQALVDQLQVEFPEGQFRCFTADATKSAEVDAAVACAVEQFGSLNGVANLIGSIILKPAHVTTDDEFEQTLKVNLHTAFYLLRASARAMMTTGGSIVFVSTVAASIGLANHEAIAAAKSGLNGLVLSAAATYASKNIRVNAVAPGLVRTPLAAKITSNELSLKASTALHPLGRIGEPEEVASAIAWFLNPANSWVTGQILGVDGGLSRVRSK